MVRLGRWVAEYYLAPPGEVFRAVLPPAVEIRRERHFAITEAGREHWRGIKEGKNGSPQTRLRHEAAYGGRGRRGRGERLFGHGFH